MTTHSVKTPYQPILSIKDKRFTIYQLQQYHLIISLSNTHLRICCMDQLSNRCLFLETYTLQADTIAATMQAIEQFWQAHPLLAMKAWHTITLCVENQQYTLVPKPLFQEKDAVAYLNLAATRNHHTVKHTIHHSLDLVVAFGLQPLLCDWFQTTYKKNTFYIIHQASSLIAGVSAYIKAKNLKPVPQLFVVASPTHVHITALERAKLCYYNQFAYANSDELLQYILIVMYTLGLDPGSQEIILGGHITKNSLTHRKLQNYIRKVTFSDQMPNLKFGWSFKKRLLTQYFDLWSVHVLSTQHPVKG